MTKYFIAALLTVPAALVAHEALGYDAAPTFFYNSANMVCQNQNGDLGTNPNFFGECGNLIGHDLSYSHVYWPSPLSLQGAILRNSNLSSATLDDASFIGSDLSGVNFSNTSLTNAVISNAVLTRVIWTGAFLSDADFTGSDLTNADLITSDNVRTNFSSAQMRGADLSHNRLNLANFGSANLKSAKLVGSFLYSADLSNADLTDADFQNSNLSGSDLTGANVSGTTFTGAYFDDGTALPFSRAVAAQKGMLYSPGGDPRVTEIKITGNSDGTCSPSMVNLQKGVPVKVTISGSSAMFMLKSQIFSLDLMSMPNQPASQKISPSQTGNFPFTCGSDGSQPQTTGMFMVM